MIYDLAREERRHRAIQNEKPAPALRRKACTCGAQVTALQLARHGSCEICRLTASLHPGDLEKLQHMLGATGRSAGAKPGFRNHYCCGQQDREAMDRLVAAGLAARGAAQLTTVYYHATKDGCRAAGLDRAGIARAIGAKL